MIIFRYIFVIIRQYFYACKKHPKFARYWASPIIWEYAEQRMKNKQKENDDSEKYDCQSFYSIIEEELLEVIEALGRKDRRGAKIELIQLIVVALRGLVKLSREK